MSERLSDERVRWIANFPPLPIDGSPSEHRLPLGEIRALAAEVLELREERSRWMAERRRWTTAYGDVFHGADGRAITIPPPATTGDTE